MINVNKYNNEFGNQIELVFPNNRKLNINFCGNLDLYLSPSYNSFDELEVSFDITEDDYDLYQIFNKLYSSIVTYKPYGDDKVDIIFKEYEKYNEYPLVKNNIIYFYSDDDPEDIASLLTISKEEDIIHIKIKKGMHMEGIISTAIRIRTNGSRYNSFFIPFMNMYKEINETDFSYHQITINEYVKKLNKTKNYHE